MLLLSTVWCVGGYSQTWVKVTDVSNLNEGDEVTFVNEKYQAALGSKKKNNFSKVNVTISNNSFENVSNLTALKLVKQGENWLFMLDNMYLYAASSSDNYLKTTDEKTNDNTRATITISNGDASIKFQGTFLKNIIRYNNGSSIFSCYGVTNNQQPIQLYKKASTGTPTTIAFNAGFDATKTYTFTDGVAPSDYTQPTVTLSTSEATGKGAIEYTSSNTNVVDVNKTTGVLSFVGKNVYDTEAIISAQFVATAGSGYANSNKLTYTVKNVEKQKTATTLTFPQKSFSFATTDDLTSFKGQTATLTAVGADMTGKTINYSKTGNDIFTSFDETTGALVLNGKAGTATVKANFAGDDTYASSTASYTVTVDQVFVDLASLKAAIPTTAKSVDDAVPFRLKLTDALVTYVNGTKAYVQDATAGVLLYDASKWDATNKVSTGNAFDLVAGQKFTGVVDVKACWYNGMAEVTAWTPAADVVKEENVDIPVKTVTLAELNGADYSKYECVRVKVENATVSTAYSNAKKATIKQGDETYFIHGEVNGLDVNKDDVCDFIGYPIYWKTKTLNEYQLSVWSQEDIIVKSSVVKTTISFDPATTEYNVDKNNKDAFTAPTATVKDAEGNVVDGAAITYTSSKPSVATVGETDGKVTFVGFGTTVITASYAGDATHMASSNSYTINYGKVKTTMSWSATEVTANLGEVFTNAPTLFLTADNVSILEGKTIKYTSTDENVAAFVDGTLKIHNEGTTTITATFAGDDTYAEASASYTLTVTDPNKLEVTFDFTNPGKYGYKTSTSNDGTGEGDVAEGKTIVDKPVIITNVIQGKPNTTFFTDNIRVYNGAKWNISIAAGYYIKQIEFVNSKSDNKFTFTPEGLNGSIWTGNASSIDIDFTGTAQFTSMTVTYAKAVIPTVTFDEEKNVNLSNYDKKTVDVTMKRTIGTGYLNPVCFPFAMGATQITEVFGEGSKVSAMADRMVDGNLHFDYVETMEAGMPYLVEPTKASTTIEVKNVTINAKPGYDVAEDNGGNLYSFQGTFNPYAFTAIDGTELFLGKDNTLYMPQSEGQRMKGFRAYFTTPKANESLKVVVNGQTTTISSLMSGKTMTGKVYNLNGQYVGTSLEGLAKGVYVMNGQKFVVK